MSSFQNQIRLLRKSTRNRLTDASARVSTEIADEAVLLHAKAMRISRASTKALKRLSFYGDVPPPPNETPSNKRPSFETTNPLYEDRSTDDLTTDSGASSERGMKKATASRTGKGKKPQQESVNRITPTVGPNGDLSWLLAATKKKLSWRFSYRELPKDHEDYQPKMFTVPINLEDDRLKRPELYASVPPGFDDDPHHAQGRPDGGSKTPAIQLDARFETYRMRAFVEVQQQTQERLLRATAKTSSPPVVTKAETPRSPTASPSVSHGNNNNNNGTAGLSPVQLAIQNLQAKSNQAKQSSSPRAVPLKDSKPSTPSSTTTTLRPVAQQQQQQQQRVFATASKLNTMADSAPKSTIPVLMCEAFERIRQREFTRVPLEIKARQEQQQQQQKVQWKAPVLNTAFEIIRHREFELVQRETKALAEIPPPPPVAINRTLSKGSGSLGRPTKARDGSLPRSLTGRNGEEVQQMNRSLKRGGGGRSVAEMPVQREEEYAGLDEDDVPLYMVPPPPMMQTPIQQQPAASFHQQAASRTPAVPSSLIYDEVPHDIPPPPFSPIHASSSSSSSSGMPQKRASLVSRAFKVISGTFLAQTSPSSSSASSGRSEGGNHGAPIPPDFPFNEFELLQLDLQRAEQQIQFRDYTHLSTVYETRNEYVESFSSAAADEWDQQRRAANMATL